MKHPSLPLLALMAAIPAPVLAQDILLQGIVVSANLSAVEGDRTGNKVDVVTEDDLKTAGNLKLADYLSRLPGLSFGQSGPTGTTGDLKIRGAGGEYISVYVDGILVTDPTGTESQFDDFGGLTTLGVRRVEVLRGSQSALYGGTAVAGVVNIETMPGDDAPEGISQTVSVEAGSFDTAMLAYSLVQRQGRLLLSFGASHAQSSGFSAADDDAPGDDNSEADGFERSRLSLGARYELTENLSIGATLFVETGSNDFDEALFENGSSRPIDGTPDEVAERDAQAARIYGTYVGELFTHEFGASIYRIERSLASPTLLSGDPYANEFDGCRQMLDYVATGQLTDQWRLSLGADLKNEKGTFSNAAQGPQSVITRGIFGETIYSPTPDLDITGTARLDDHSRFGSEVTGRLTFAWRPTEADVVRGAIANGYRAPSLDELYGEYPDPFFYFSGNPDLEPETSRSVEFGYDHSFPGGAQISATLFRMEIDNAIVLASDFSTVENRPGQSTRQGVELGGFLPLSEKTSLTAAYTYVDAREANGDRVPRVPRDQFVLGLETQLTEALSGALTLRHVADRHDRGDMPDYTVAQALVQFELDEQTEAYLRVDNLFDEKYQEVRGYGTSDRAFYVGLRKSF